MEFQYSKTKSVLQGLQQVPQVSLEDANAFKLSNKRKRYDTLPPQYITPDHLCPRDNFYFYFFFFFYEKVRGLSCHMGKVVKELSWGGKRSYL